MSAWALDTYSRPAEIPLWSMADSIAPRCSDVVVVGEIHGELRGGGPPRQQLLRIPGEQQQAPRTTSASVMARTAKALDPRLRHRLAAPWRNA